MLESKPYEPSVRDILESEIKKMGFGVCKVVIYEDPREVEDIDNLTTSRFGLTDSEEPRVEFYTSIIDEIWNDQQSFILKKYSSLEKYIQAIVRHEYRHYEQYRHIVKKGLDLDLILRKNETLEKDAYDYEHGIVNDLDKLL